MNTNHALEEREHTLEERDEGHRAKVLPRNQLGLRRRRLEVGTTWHLRCTRRARVDSSIAELLPLRVSVMPDGTACAEYVAGGGVLFFHDLAHLLAHHGLSMRDFEEDHV
jgi:hypothetical protein